jgi:hypothetical protein
MLTNYEVIAIIISLLSVVFTASKWASEKKEQKLRLRPQIYIEDIINTNFTSNSLMLKITIKNVGLLPAKNMTILRTIRTDNYETSLGGEHPSKGLIVPNQTLFNTPIITGQAFINIFNSKTEAHLVIRIDYESGDNKYFYEVRNLFDPIGRRWAMLEGDAN